MSKINLHKLYYKEYFKEHLEKKTISETKKTLLDAELHKIPAPYSEGEYQSLHLMVDYPGLITGVGLPHELGESDKNEFKLGMHFDYTYGMPIIYGSSVKGVLKSYMKYFYEDNDREKLKTEIFEGKRNGESIPPYERDIFFDAVIVSGCNDNDSKIIEKDTIAPHGENPFKSPTPISFIKIAAGCTIEFRFLLHDSRVNNKITKEKKLEMFEKCLTKFGIGAKTNIGYGQFSPPKRIINK